MNDTDLFINELKLLYNLLDSVNEKFWSSKIKSLISSCESQAIMSGYKGFVSMCGGMGSLNDLYLCEINGHSLKDNDEESINELLKSYTSKLYNMAYKKIRELEDV